MYNTNGSFIQIFNTIPLSLIILVGAFAGGLIAYYTTNASKDLAENSKANATSLSNDLSNNINNL